ncbi:MAG: hypothetical protein LBL07_08880 [Tannerella sp.]|nr:hypothetical protein [Tannerella sp.]
MFVGIYCDFTRPVLFPAGDSIRDESSAGNNRRAAYVFLLIRFPSCRGMYKTARPQDKSPGEAVPDMLPKCAESPGEVSDMLSERTESPNEVSGKLSEYTESSGEVSGIFSECTENSSEVSGILSEYTESSGEVSDILSACIESPA